VTLTRRPRHTGRGRGYHRTLDKDTIHSVYKKVSLSAAPPPSILRYRRPLAVRVAARPPRARTNPFARPAAHMEILAVQRPSAIHASSRRTPPPVHACVSCGRPVRWWNG